MCPILSTSPTRSQYKVALFFRSGRPHSLAPGSILVVPNYDSAVNRTVRHRGFVEGPEATRQLTVDEQEWAAGTTRYKLEYYGTWEKLIADEEELLAADPSVGNHFLDVCRRLSTHRDYRPATPLRGRNEPTEAEQLAAMTEEIDGRHGHELDEFERRAAADTARAIGATQLTLFGDDVLGLTSQDDLTTLTI